MRRHFGRLLLGSLFSGRTRKYFRPKQYSMLNGAAGRWWTAPEGIGLRSIAQGFAALGISDEERLLRQFPIYDALYAYVERNLCVSD